MIVCRFTTAHWVVSTFGAADGSLLACCLGWALLLSRLGARVCRWRSLSANDTRIGSKQTDRKVLKFEKQKQFIPYHLTTITPLLSMTSLELVNSNNWRLFFLRCSGPQVPKSHANELIGRE